jgi:hypothetical protein
MMRFKRPFVPVFRIERFTYVFPHEPHAKRINPRHYPGVCSWSITMKWPNAVRVSFGLERE